MNILDKLILSNSNSTHAWVKINDVLRLKARTSMWKPNNNATQIVERFNMVFKHGNPKQWDQCRNEKNTNLVNIVDRYKSIMENAKAV